VLLQSESDLSLYFGRRPFVPFVEENSGCGVHVSPLTLVTVFLYPLQHLGLKPFCATFLAAPSHKFVVHATFNISGAHLSAEPSSVHD
jgi:hypothetical protein